MPRDAAGERWLAAVIAVLCFLACLAAVGAVAADRAAHGWARELRAEATVQVRPRVGESGDTAAARAAETLAGVNGVAEAAAMDRETAEDLLRPWMGEAVLADLPLPFLVTVGWIPKRPASALTLGRALAEAGLDATVDDHSLWRGEVERSAMLITLLALAAFLTTAFAAAAAIIYAVRAGIEAQARGHRDPQPVGRDGRLDRGCSSAATPCWPSSPGRPDRSRPSCCSPCFGRSAGPKD